MIDYADRLFRAVHVESDGRVTGDVDGDTVFRYDQRGSMLTGTYSGGQVAWGSLVGRVQADGRLEFVYHHMTKSGDLRAGRCDSRPEILETGRLRLHERWAWHDGSGTGRSLLEEI